jgi:diaminopimelate decarboxylase
VRVVTSVGWSSQFGLAIRTGDAFAAFERISRWGSLAAQAVHLHIGTGLKNVATYTQAIEEVLEFAGVLRKRLGIELTLYDLGGGFGVPTVRSLDNWDDALVEFGYPVREAFPEDCPKPGEYAREIARLFSSYGQGAHASEIVLEPGRAITSSAQTLLLSVIAVKNTGESRKLILNGGKNVTLPLSWEVHKILPVTGFRRSFDAKTDLYGPLCHPGDIVSRHLMLPELQAGEVIAIMDAGAYFIPNQMNFSNPRPGVITVDRGKAHLVRRPESFEDIVRLDEIERA